jgi:hypothetical protein
VDAARGPEEIQQEVRRIVDQLLGAEAN